MTQQHDSQSPDFHETDGPDAASVEQQLADQVERLTGELEQLRAQVLLERADLEDRKTTRLNSSHS